jgi:hypothetical protein
MEKDERVLFLCPCRCCISIAARRPCAFATSVAQPCNSPSPHALASCVGAWVLGGKGQLTLVVGKEAAAFEASGIVLGGLLWRLAPGACRDCAQGEWLGVSERWCEGCSTQEVACGAR